MKDFGKVAVVIVLIILIIFFIIWVINSCEGEKHGTNEIGDFKEILKLSVLSIDYEDAYVIERNIGSNEDPVTRKVVYVVKAHGEYKYNLEDKSLIIDSITGKRTLVLPPCSLEISLNGAPKLEYVQKDKAFINPKNISQEDDNKYRAQINDSIKARLSNNIYKREAFRHAEKLLKTFFKNMGDTAIVIRNSDNL